MEEQNMQQGQSQAEQPQTQAPQSGQESVMQADPADVEKNKTMAILSYFIFFLPLITDAKDSPFAKFHANQSLVLLLFIVVGNIVAGMLSFVLIGFLLMPILGIAAIIFWIMGLMNAANGKIKELPLIGGIHILDK